MSLVKSIAIAGIWIGVGIAFFACDRILQSMIVMFGFLAAALATTAIVDWKPD